jgi:hypothetical protein
MGREDRAQFQSVRGERRPHGSGIAGIDDRDRARIARPADQPDVVVLERRDRRDVEHA